MRYKIRIRKSQINSLNLMINERLTKILTLIAFMFIILVLVIIALTPNASSYEISIYDVYPWYFWGLLISSMSIGQVIILKNYFIKTDDRENRFWYMGLFVVLTSIIILLFLTYIRGYPTYGRGDHLTHIGIVKDIIKTGYFDQTNFYPNLHILTASFSEISGSGIVSTANFLSRFFFFISPISMYLFFRIIFRNKNEMKIALVIASSFLFFAYQCIYLAQSPLSFLFLPFILYLYFRRGIAKDSIAFSFIFVIFITGYNFYHPLNTLFLIIIFVFLAFSLYIYPKINGIFKIKGSRNLITKKSVSAILLTSIIFLTWYFSFSSIIGGFRRVFTTILLGSSGSFFEAQAAVVSSYAPGIIDIIEVVFYKYGQAIIVGFVTTLCLIYAFMRWLKNRKNYRVRFIFIASSIGFLAFYALALSAFFMDFIVGWGRFYRWGVFLSLIIISIIFYQIATESNERKISLKFFKKSYKTVMMSFLLILLLILTTFSLYDSPNMKEPNGQVTYMEYEGMKWFFTHRDINNQIVELGISQQRFFDAIKGLMENRKMIRHDNTTPPDHFGYYKSNKFGNYYNENRYVIITYLGRILYPEMYPNYKQFWRFTSDDFKKLNNDNSVNLIYSNQGFETYFTRSNED